MTERFGDDLKSSCRGLDCHVRKDPNVSVLTVQGSEVTLTTGGSRLGSSAGGLTLPAEDKLIILKKASIAFQTYFLVAESMEIHLKRSFLAVI